MLFPAFHRVFVPSRPGPSAPPDPTRLPLSTQKKGLVNFLQEFSIPLIAGVFAALLVLRRRQRD